MTTAAPTTAPTTRSTDRMARSLLVLGAAAVGAMLVNAAIATGALAVGAGSAPIGLDPVAYLSASVVGVLVATAGWALVRRLSARPAAVLRVLVPVVLVLTWVPDVAVLLGGAAVVNAVALMVMHAVVAAGSVLALRRVLPV